MTSAMMRAGLTMGYHSEYPWQRIGRTDYILTRDSGSAPKGFVFQVSVPRALEWLVNPHDPEWLWVARRHDTRLHLHKWPAAKAACAMRQDMRDKLTGNRRWLIEPTFLAVLIWTTLSPPIRRVFSWKEE
jgi:hypothetical protein